MKSLLCGCFALLLALPVVQAEEPRAANLHLNLRSRVQPFKGVDRWEEVALPRDFVGSETALIICDMWDKHWCESASRRCDALARKMEPVLQAARAKGVTIIHAPSECMEYYKDTPQRKRMLALAKVEPPKPLELPDPPVPIDDKDGGCDDANPVQPYKAWTREHPALTMAAEDYVSDNGREVYNLLRHKGIKTVLIAGVHTNMCICNRSFAIKQLTRWGMPCILIRDLTDSMYNPKRAPFVTHDEGTELVVQHIEKHWAPTIQSSDLVPPSEKVRNR